MNVPDDFSSFTDCQDLTFVGWAESPIGSTPAAAKPTLAEVGSTMPAANKDYYAVFAAGSAGTTTWERVTSLATLTAGGTFIMGYEATANSGVIIPMQNTGTLTTSATGYIYSGTGTSGSDNTGTLDMSETVASSNKYEITVVASAAVEGAINIKFGDNFLGNENSKNCAKLYNADAATTAFTPTKGENDAFTLDIEANTSGSAYRYLKYNTGSPRFAVYSTESEKLVFYKKSTSADTYHDWVTVCPHCNSVALTKAGETNGTFKFQRNSADVTSVNTCEEITVDIVASPATGYELTNIVVSGVAGASYSAGVITIPQDAEGTLLATATFSQKNYSIAVQTYPDAIGATLSGNTTTAHYGEEMTISTDEPAGYLFGGWYLFDASTFDAENIDWDADLSSEIFTGTYEGEDYELEASFLMPDKNFVAVAYFDRVYSPAEALALTDLSDSVFVEGIISQVDEVSVEHNNATYYISADGTTTNQLKIYRGKHLNKKTITDSNKDEIAVGNKVIVRGKLSVFSATNQFGQGASYIYDLTEKQLSALAIVGTPITSYEVGQSFDMTGLSLTATYNTGYVVANYTGTTMTSDYDAPQTFADEGEVNVTVSASEIVAGNPVEASRVITVTVSGAQLDHIVLTSSVQTEFWAKEQYKEPLLDAYLDDNVTVINNVTGTTDKAGLDMSVAGDKSVTVTYERNGVSKTVQYDFTVKAVVVDEANAHSVATAREIIDKDREDGENLDLANNATKTHVIGRVTNVTALTGADEGKYTIVIKDETDAAKVMTLYKVTLKSGITSVKADDLIKAYGNLYYHSGSSKYEINEGGEVVWKQPKVSIVIAKQTLEVGQNLTIADVATINPSEATMTYSIKDDGVSSDYVSLAGGVITANAVGTATIIAHAAAYNEYLSNEIEFEVEVVEAGSVKEVVILVQFDGKYLAMNDEMEAVEVDYQDGKLFDVSAADQAKIVWTRTIAGGKATFTIDGKYLKGSTSTTMTVAEGATGAYQWTWNEAGYYTTNTSGTIRTFLYQGNSSMFKNFAVSNAGKALDGGYSTYAEFVETPVFLNREVVRGSLFDGKWGTICPTKEVKYPTGASFYTLTYKEVQAGVPYKVFFDEIAEGASLVAGKPYLFIAEGEAIKGIKVGDAATEGENDYNGFHGILEAAHTTLTVTAQDEADYKYYIVYGNEIRLCGAGSFNVPVERAYLEMSAMPTDAVAPMPGRRRVCLTNQAAQTVTGIDALNALETPVKMIIDGQLFIIRGEKMYNANGQLVK